jgi:hypothetical protein
MGAMVGLLERLQTQARDDIAVKVAALTRELEERLDREFPPSPEGPDGADAEAAARASARHALRDWIGAVKGELEEGAIGMLDAVSRKNPGAFDGSLPPDKESLLFEKVSEGVRQTVDQILAAERREIERRLEGHKRRRDEA